MSCTLMAWLPDLLIHLYLRVTVSRSLVSFQSKLIRRGKTQIGPVDHPIPDIVIETSSPINRLLHRLRKMGVPEDDDLKTF